MRFFRVASSFRALSGMVAAYLLASGLAPRAQEAQITAQVQVVQSKAERHGKKASSAGGTEPSDVVIWLTPQDTSALAAPASPQLNPRLVQQNKQFEPRLLVVRVGTLVEFPNADHFFHNVFSLHDGKRFDLGFYEAGSSRSVRFDRLGVSFLFCNIHPEMSATVVAVDTPYFGVSDGTGRIVIPGVPDGVYVLHVWWERSLADKLKALERTVNISSSDRALGAIRVIENPNFTLAHKNKFGQDYVPPSISDYSRP